MRRGGRLVAACAVAVAVGFGPTAAWAADGPAPPAWCFQPDASGDYPTCTFVHGVWVRGDGAGAQNHASSDAVLGGGLALAVLLAWAALRASSRRRVEVHVPAQVPREIVLDAEVGDPDQTDPVLTR